MLQTSFLSCTVPSQFTLSLEFNGPKRAWRLATGSNLSLRMAGTCNVGQTVYYQQ